MRAASKASLESGREVVNESFELMTSPGQQGLDLANALFSVAELLSTNDRLARSLTDPSRTSDEKSNLVKRVLADYIGPTCMDVLVSLVSGVWVDPSDLTLGIEDLGIESVLLSAYSSNEIPTVCQELGELFQLLVDNRDLRTSFSDLGYLSQEQRVQLAHKLLDNRLTVWTMTLFLQLISKRQTEGLLASARVLAARAAERMGAHMVFVTAAAPLGASQKQRLCRILEEQLHEKVNVMVTVDDTVIGGMFINTGVQSLDMSLLTRFNKLKRACVY